VNVGAVATPEAFAPPGSPVDDVRLTAPRRYGPGLLMVAVGTVLSTSRSVTAVAAEFLVRWLDKGGEIGSAAQHLDEIPLAPGVERAWFYETPPPQPRTVR